MRIDTNFRATERRRHDRLVAVLVVASVGICAIAVTALADINDKRQRKMQLEGKMTVVSQQRHELEREMSALSEIEANGNSTVLNWLASLKPYRGKGPGALLYTLEKTLPEEVYLLDVEYDRGSGVATLSAVSGVSDAIGDLIMSLKRKGEFSKVRLINKSEYDEQGSSKFVLRLTYAVRDEK